MSLERASRASNYGARIWKLVAFLGRYAHQPATVSLQLPVDDLQRLAVAVGELLEAEAEAAKPRGD